MATQEMREFVENNAGFFNGVEPSHEDVDSYFTQENFIYMFGRQDGQMPEDFDWNEAKAAAHEMIDERVEA